MKPILFGMLVTLAACSSNPCLDHGPLSDYARDEVRERLKAPTTVDFTDETIEENPAKTGMIVKGDVTAQNPMGVPITSKYSVVVECVDGKPSTQYGDLGELHWGTAHEAFEATMDSINEAGKLKLENIDRTIDSLNLELEQ